DANQELHREANELPLIRLITRSPYNYENKKYGIVLLVVSAIHEREERQQIRRLWASEEESNMQKVRKSVVIFLVGESSSESIENEAMKYEDILQVTTPETYRNLVYKIAIGFRWLKANIDTEFVAKIDTDTVVHIDVLYETLKRYESHYGSKDWVACSSITDAGPVRWDRSPWYVSREDYEESEYPRYCNGPGYVMPKRTLEKIVLEVEDVFFTGIVAQAVGIMHIGEGVVSHQYDSNAFCSSAGPIMSILNTHWQLSKDTKTDRDLTVAWNTLTNAYCYQSV
ncbi:hypothetical protein PMAYCL1PPCAC_08665, partial [Pristionchus mayeri]